jgi:Rrf2 family protein
VKISTKIRYGTRAMLELACHYGEGPIELREIAKREDISLKYLEQVIVPFAPLAWLNRPAVPRGLFLGETPSEIYLKDLVETLDGPLNLIECLKDPKACQKVPYCVTGTSGKKCQKRSMGFSFGDVGRYGPSKKEKKFVSVDVPNIKINSKFEAPACAEAASAKAGEIRNMVIGYQRSGYQVGSIDIRRQV